MYVITSITFRPLHFFVRVLGLSTVTFYAIRSPLIKPSFSGFLWPKRVQRFYITLRQPCLCSGSRADVAAATLVSQTNSVGVELFTCTQAKSWHFYSIKHSGLNFRKFVVTSGTSISWISRKEENLARCNEIFGNFFPRSSVPFDLNPASFGEMVLAFWET